MKKHKKITLKSFMMVRMRKCRLGVCAQNRLIKHLCQDQLHELRLPWLM
jgi:hypothetical protein